MIVFQEKFEFSKNLSSQKKMNEQKKFFESRARVKSQKSSKRKRKRDNGARTLMCTHLEPFLVFFLPCLVTTRGKMSRP